MDNWYNTKDEYSDPRNYDLKGVLLELVVLVIVISSFVTLLMSTL